MKKFILSCWIISSMSLSAQDKCKGFNPDLKIVPGKPVKNLTIEEGIAICENNHYAKTSTIQVMNHALALARERNQQYQYNKPLPDTVDEGNYTSILRDRDFTVETSEIIGIHTLDCYIPHTGAFSTVSRPGYLDEHWLNTFGFIIKSLACWNSNKDLPRLKKQEFITQGITPRELAPPLSSPQQARELAPPPPTGSDLKQASITPRELAPPPPADDDCCKTKKVKNPCDTCTLLLSLDDCDVCDVQCCQPCCTIKTIKKSTKTRMPATDALLGRVKTSSYSSKNSYSWLLLGL